MPPAGTPQFTSRSTRSHTPLQSRHAGSDSDFFDGAQLIPAPALLFFVYYLRATRLRTRSHHSATQSRTGTEKLMAEKVGRKIFPGTGTVVVVCPADEAMSTAGTDPGAAYSGNDTKTAAAFALKPREDPKPTSASRCGSAPSSVSGGSPALDRAASSESNASSSSVGAAAAQILPGLAATAPSASAMSMLPKPVALTSVDSQMPAAKRAKTIATALAAAAELSAQTQATQQAAAQLSALTAAAALQQPVPTSVAVAMQQAALQQAVMQQAAVQQAVLQQAALQQAALQQAVALQHAVALQQPSLTVPAPAPASRPKPAKAQSSATKAQRSAAAQAEDNKASRRGKYKCGRCGMPKVGHVCHMYVSARATASQCDLRVTKAGQLPRSYNKIMKPRQGGSDGNASDAGTGAGASAAQHESQDDASETTPARPAEFLSL